MMEVRFHSIRKVKLIFIYIFDSPIEHKLNLPHIAAIGAPSWRQTVISAHEISLDGAGI